MTENAARLKEQLCFSLYCASGKLTAIYRPILAPFGITYTQFVVMMALWENDGVSITELAGSANLTKATMTPLLKNLESKSLIKFGRVQGNDRKKLVELTAQGKKLASCSHAATNEAFCATGLSLEEAKTMIELCKKIGLQKDRSAK